MWTLGVLLGWVMQQDSYGKNGGFSYQQGRVCSGEEIYSLVESVQLPAEIAVMHSQPTRKALQESVGITQPGAAVKAVARQPLGQSGVVAVTRGKGQI